MDSGFFAQWGSIIVLCSEWDNAIIVSGGDVLLN